MPPTPGAKRDHDRRRRGRGRRPRSNGRPADKVARRAARDGTPGWKGEGEGGGGTVPVAGDTDGGRCRKPGERGGVGREIRQGPSGVAIGPALHISPLRTRRLEDRQDSASVLSEGGRGTGHPRVSASPPADASPPRRARPGHPSPRRRRGRSGRRPKAPRWSRARRCPRSVRPTK